MENKKLLTVGDLATLFDKAPQTIRNWEYTKGLKPDLVEGSKRFYSEETVEKFLEKVKEEINYEEN